MALSFAAAQRDYVERVAWALQAQGVRCFYDADEEIDLWGSTWPRNCQLSMGSRPTAVVVFMSAEYAARDWTRLERRAALDRAVRVSEADLRWLGVHAAIRVDGCPMRSHRSTCRAMPTPAGMACEPRWRPDDHSA